MQAFCVPLLATFRKGATVILFLPGQKVLLLVFRLMFSETITKQLDEMVHQQLDKTVGQHLKELDREVNNTGDNCALRQKGCRVCGQYANNMQA